MRTTAPSQHAGDTHNTRKAKEPASVRGLLIRYGYQPAFSWYFIGVIARILWTLVYPQQGYIHPDEFFQGPEIVFDDLFQTNLTRTHEFQSTEPLRSVAILYLLYGLPVSTLSWLSSFFHWSSIPFDLKLILPRAVILSLSLCTDILFYRLIKSFYPTFNTKQHGILMNYYGIAHVTLVFFTRTLSNSFEAFLFLALIYVVHRNISSVLSLIINSTDENRSDSDADQPLVQSELSTMTIDRQLMSTSSLIGLICALGIFNRPTFPAFALVPLIYWFTNIFPTIGHSFRFHVLLSRVISLIVGTFLFTSSLIILFDSYYYNQGFAFLIDLKTRLIICPLNFILYNIDSTNLDKHGLHPPWLHFVVNATILYGPLHFCVILWSLFHISSVKQFGQSIIDQVTKVFCGRSSTPIRSSDHLISPLLPCLYLVPFLPLSTFPHQEPRFLLPLLFPLILFTVPLLILNNLHQSIFRIWLAFNLCLAIIYGHLHQGGLLPALRHVHDSPGLSSNIVSTAFDINEKILVTYHTYMPPGYLVTSMSNADNEQKIRTKIIDLQGAKREELDLTIEKIFHEHSINEIQVFLVLPGTCRTDLIHLKQQKYSFHLLKQFGPHLDLDHGFEEPFHVKYAGTKTQWIHTLWQKYKLDLYQVTRG